MARQLPRDDRTFIDLVQDHERAWGTQSYAERPSLQHILAAPVVVFWKPINDNKETRWTISLHTSLDDIERTLTHMLFRGHVQTPNRTMARIFVGSKRARVKRVRIEFDTSTDDPT